MEKKPFLSNSHVRTKIKPYVRWDKDTDEWTCYSYEEEVIEPIEEKNMGKVKGQLENPNTGPTIEYYPSYVPIERELLYAISNLVVAARNKKESIVDLPECIETVDEWLTERYEALEDHVLESGNGHLPCEKD